MGAVKKPIRKIARAVKKQVKKASYAVQGGKAKARGTPSKPASVTAAPSTAAAKQQEEEVATTVETGAGVQRRRRRGKKALVLGQGSAQVAGASGGTGLNIPKT
ncbi:hypothetical protein OAA57_00725 [bacterium]|jgi:hypothetical protein|nr:hypothetical protein [bacterium]MDB4350085.1 hypothetical protein [bacterium]|tara:strand:- start:6 stop:317 length:312 start_codon:yes stop_codon:yes gene_type:complete